MHLLNVLGVAVTLSSGLMPVTAQVTTSCNPTKGKYRYRSLLDHGLHTTGSCPSDQALDAPTYSIDFTQTKSVPTEWTVANDETVSFGPDGAEFTFAKRYDAPTM